MQKAETESKQCPDCLSHETMLVHDSDVQRWACIRCGRQFFVTKTTHVTVPIKNYPGAKVRKVASL